MLSSINSRTLSSKNVTFCLESSTMRRRSGMTERGWSEEFNTRTGIDDFPSSLTEPIPRADSEEEAYMREREGEQPIPFSFYRRLRRRLDGYGVKPFARPGRSGTAWHPPPSQRCIRGRWQTLVTL